MAVATGKGEEIKKLREQGMSYRQIKKALNVSNGTIGYHLGDGQKIKTLERQRALVAAKPKPEKIPKEPKPKKIKEIKVKDLEKFKKEPMKNSPDRRERSFKTLPVDLSQLIEIQIDHKKKVYAKQGCDVEAIKAKYAPKQVKIR